MIYLSSGQRERQGSKPRKYHLTRYPKCAILLLSKEESYLLQITRKGKCFIMAKVTSTVVEGVSGSDVDMLMDVLSKQFGTVQTPKGEKQVTLVKVEVAPGVYSIQSVGSVSSSVRESMILAKDLLEILRSEIQNQQEA